MKRIIAGFFVLVCLAPVVPAIASEAFIFDIPTRGNTQQETGEAKALLGLSAAPAGAQLVVNGSTTLNLGDTMTIAGDAVSFTAGTGNSVFIDYKPLSNFSGDFCTAVGAVEKQIPMRFVGAQDVVDYRMVTYIVGAPNAECSKVSKHTGDMPAFLTPNDDGVAPALVADFKGRLPYDVALVLDKSGSMSEFPPGANAGPTKADYLKTAIQAFVGNWQLMDAPNPPTDNENDRLAVVFFDSTAASQTMAAADPPANIFLKRSNNWQTVINTANGLTPGSSTSIGAGINEAMSQWKSDPKNDLSLVVVTDGKQNTNPLIQPTASGFLGLAPVAGFPQELRQRFVPINTIGFGAPAMVDEDLLSNIGLQTSGVSYLDITASTMFDVFANTLIALLKGNTASLGRRIHDTMTGTGPGPLQNVQVDRSPRRVVYSLQWAPPANQVLDLDVYRPGASAPSSPSATKKLPQTTIKSFDLTGREANLGTWGVRVKRAPKSDTTQVPYTLNVFFVEGHLDYQLSLDRFKAYAGEKIGVRAVIDWDGKKLSGLPPGSVRARLFAQSQALGTILHDVRMDTSRLPTVHAGDPQSALDLKLAAFKGDSLLARIALKEAASVVLDEESPGVYSGFYDQTSIPGQYAFEIVLDWNTERTGRVHREERIEQIVNIRADRTKTEITSKMAANGLWTITVVPRDRFGNYFGPGYDQLITARLLTRGGLRSPHPTDPNQTGTYSFVVADVPKGETPQLDIVVDGVNLSQRRE